MSTRFARLTTDTYLGYPLSRSHALRNGDSGLRMLSTYGANNISVP